MSTLTAKARNKLSEGSFVFPSERRYPIHDLAHARNALARSSGKPEEAQVRSAVHAKYPGIGKEAMAGFLDELEKIALSGHTVWGPGGAFEKCVARELKVPHQVRDLAEEIVRRGHPIYKKWPLRTISHWAARR